MILLAELLAGCLESDAVTDPQAGVGRMRVALIDADRSVHATAIAGEDSAFAYADTLDGGFHYPMLTAGAYDLVFTATTGSYRDTTLAGVPVLAGQEPDPGTVILEAESTPIPASARSSDAAS